MMIKSWEELLEIKILSIVRGESIFKPPLDEVDD